jgi:cell division protein FtsZ
MPFPFVGKRKSELAENALGKRRDVCYAVAVIGNERLSGGSPSSAVVAEAFLLADRTLLACTRALHGMMMTSGPVRITRSDMKAVLGIPGSKTLFGSGTATGSNRLHEALEAALSCPLMIQQGKTSPGSSLLGVPVILLLIRGPADLSFAEVQTAVDALERVAGDRCLIKTGVLASLPGGAPLTISIMASSGGGATAATPSPASSVRRDAAEGEIEGAVSGKVIPESGPRKPTRTSSSAKAAPSSPKQTQGTLDLDTYQRGRFDKSEPTIVAGEDLDVPTFLRKGIKLTPPRKG